jgi:hypothetical protein
MEIIFKLGLVSMLLGFILLLIGVAIHSDLLMQIAGIVIIIFLILAAIFGIVAIIFDL